MQAIYGIKAGFMGYTNLHKIQIKEKLYKIYKNVSQIRSGSKVCPPQKLLHNAVKDFYARDIRFVILGCTEIPLVLNKKYSQNCILIDPTEIVSNATIDYMINIQNSIRKYK